MPRLSDRHGVPSVTEPGWEFGDVSSRAASTNGTSAEPIYRMAAATLAAKGASGLVVDVGCGAGHLWPYVREMFHDYIGVDVLRYASFPDDLPFRSVDLDTGKIPLANGSAEAVVAIETIEHLENPRAFFRELTRVAKPGGWIVVTTPNQRSFLSLLSLAVKGHFVAFQDSSYPAHLTALLEMDLRRIAAECGLSGTEIHYSKDGRIPLTARHYPAALSRLFPRILSDTLLLLARKPS